MEELESKIEELIFALKLLSEEERKEKIKELVYKDKNIPDSEKENLILALRNLVNE